MRRFTYLYGGAIGDALLGIHIARTLSENEPGARLELVSTRQNQFVRELAAELPFVSYRELRKESFSSWLTLPFLALRPSAAVVFDPVSSSMPLWWRLILWSGARMPGSVVVHGQMRGHERPLPRGAVACGYDREESLFDLPPRILSAWGIPALAVPVPSLPRTPSPIPEPYLLFHFFAGHFRRSIPVDHARAILAAARAAFPELLFVVTCAAGESDVARRMVEGVSNARLDINPTASRMLGLLSGARAVVGTASGILLVAAHLHAKVIAMSCLIYPGWLPTFSASTVILAAREECQCVRGHPERCVVSTPEGEVFRCLYFITTEEVLAALQERLAVS